MEKLTYYWNLADGIGMNPLIAIVGICLYFMLRWGFGFEKWKAIAGVFAVNLLGQIRITKDALANWDDVLFLAIGQAALAFGIYSTLEVIKIIDVADALKNAVISKIKKMFGGQDNPAPPNP